MKLMKILHFIEHLGSGGKERQLLELLKGLSKHKNIISELAIMSHHIHYADVVSNLDVRKHYLIRNNKKDPEILLKLYRLCKKRKPDIINTWGSMTSVYAAPIAKLLGIKFVNGMIRNAPAKLAPFSKYWIRSKLTFPYSDIILANSYAGLNSYNAKTKKCVCIYNGFDFSRLENLMDKNTLRKKNTIKTNHIVGMIGRFSESKDYETFISAAGMVLQKREDVTFLAIGEGVNCEKCKHLRDTRFQNKIKLLDKQNDVESIINLFDVGVLATYTEGISNAIMEYMALGKPVVATRCDGTMELVSEGETGLLVKTGDAADMSKKILHLLENKALAVKMGNAGKERIHNVFSSEKMTDSYIDLYSDLLG